MVPMEFFRLLQGMDLEEVMAQIEQSQAEMEDIISLLGTLEEMRSRMATNLQNATNRKAALTPRNSNQVMIMDHIRSQTAARAAKADTFSRLRSVLGVQGKIDLDPRAPIGKAMERKKGRGRPTRI